MNDLIQLGSWQRIDTIPFNVEVILIWSESCGLDDSRGIGMLSIDSEEESYTWYIACDETSSYEPWTGFPDPSHWMPLASPPNEPRLEIEEMETMEKRLQDRINEYISTKH